MPPTLPKIQSLAENGGLKTQLCDSLCSFPLNFKLVTLNDGKERTGILMLKSDSSVFLTSDLSGDDTHVIGAFEAGK